MSLSAAKVIERIPVVDSGNGTVDCVVQEAGLRELRNWHRLIHDPFIATDPARLDRSWSWTRYLIASYVLNESHGRLTEAFQIVVASPTGRSVPVGLSMLVTGYPHPGGVEAMSTFVWFLTSTPKAALVSMGVTDRFVVMPLLLDTAVQASRWHGLGGRTSLHADHRGTKRQQDDLVQRYLRCGLTRRRHLQGSLLSVFRRMDDRYFVYDAASAHACTLKWNPLR
jgi:hypothetical protein